MRFPSLRGPVRHMKLIGDDPRFQELRRRNDERIAALKKAGRLYEDREKKHESAAPSDEYQRTINSLYNAACPGNSAVGAATWSNLHESYLYGGSATSQQPGNFRNFFTRPYPSGPWDDPYGRR